MANSGSTCSRLVKIPCRARISSRFTRQSMLGTTSSLKIILSSASCTVAVLPLPLDPSTSSRGALGTSCPLKYSFLIWALYIFSMMVSTSTGTWISVRWLSRTASRYFRSAGVSSFSMILFQDFAGWVSPEYLNLFFQSVRISGSFNTCMRLFFRRRKNRCEKKAFIHLNTR